MFKFSYRKMRAIQREEDSRARQRRAGGLPPPPHVYPNARLHLDGKGKKGSSAAYRK